MAADPSACSITSAAILPHALSLRQILSLACAVPPLLPHAYFMALPLSRLIRPKKLQQRRSRRFLLSASPVAPVRELQQSRTLPPASLADAPDALDRAAARPLSFLLRTEPLAPLSFLLRTEPLAPSFSRFSHRIRDLSRLPSHPSESSSSAARPLSFLLRTEPLAPSFSRFSQSHSPLPSPVSLARTLQHFPSRAIFFSLAATSPSLDFEHSSPLYLPSPYTLRYSPLSFLSVDPWDGLRMLLMLRFMLWLHYFNKNTWIYAYVVD